MDPADFVDDLERVVAESLARLGEAAVAAPAPAVEIAALLVTALKKELEASEEAALWLVREPDVDVKLALARQCGDEAKHYRLIEQRLRELGVDAAKIAPLADGPTPMFAYLEQLGSTVERVAAGPFTREALAKVQNEIFIELCDARGDAATARLYREVIQPDELFHHEMGKRLLRRLAVDDDAQEKARAASARTLEIAATLQEAARVKKGISRAPGC